MLWGCWITWDYMAYIDLNGITDDPRHNLSFTPLGCGGLLWSKDVGLRDYADTDYDFDTEQDTDDYQHWTSPDGDYIGFWKSDGHCVSIWEKMTIMLYQPVDGQTKEKVSAFCWQTDKNVTGISLFYVWRVLWGWKNNAHVTRHREIWKKFVQLQCFVESRWTKKVVLVRGDDRVTYP